MNKIINVIKNESGDGDLETKWFLIDYSDNSESMCIRLKENTVKEAFTAIRSQFEPQLLEASEQTGFRTLSGRYGNAVSSLKRSIMQELIIIVTGLFLNYFSIDSTYATARDVIRQLFGLSVKREVVLSSFASGGRQADRKSGWFSMQKYEKSMLFDCFNDVINSGQQYEAIKSRLDDLVAATKR
ncbi:hypothetical protein CG428_12725 [Pantoea ananatis]|uniref:hypothetical protein n=1 Tax=Pantoea ananas TaxID=553 RepID=UPI000CF5529B|nr:hypothetical protein [Pantoea ananatis]PQK74283.1 hypothetical protein CG428_12725 [Pantoea ananatis]